MNLETYRANPYVWPGGYALLAVMSDGAYLCHDCVMNPDNPVREDEDGDPLWRVIGYDVHWEGPPEHCAHCGRALPSEHGE